MAKVEITEIKAQVKTIFLQEILITSTARGATISLAWFL